MRTVATASLLVASLATFAHAEPVIHEDGALGVELVAGRSLLAEGRGMTAAIDACVARTQPTGSPVFWIELTAKGAVGGAKVHGTGKPVLDTCLAAALRKGAGADKLGKPVIVVGRIELAGDEARVSNVPVVLEAHDAALQVTINQIGYSMNRAADISAALAGASAAIGKCAAKRPARDGIELGVAWIARPRPKAKVAVVVRSGSAPYDACVGKVLSSLALPSPASAVWLVIALAKPAERLAPHTDKASMSRQQALRDAMTTALRSRKDALLTCLDNRQGKLEKVTLALRATKLVVKHVETGNADANACVKQKLDGVAIPNAEAGDTAEHEIMLERS
ncbi:MAG: hypothetical protein WKG01_32715 [Kofleriaceae bacterium]